MLAFSSDQKCRKPITLDVKSRSVRGIQGSFLFFLRRGTTSKLHLTSFRTCQWPRLGQTNGIRSWWNSLYDEKLLSSLSSFSFLFFFFLFQVINLNEGKKVCRSLFEVLISSRNIIRLKLSTKIHWLSYSSINNHSSLPIDKQLQIILNLDRQSTF